MIRNRIFYTLKPVIPRRLQLFLRRQLVGYQLARNHLSWPIDPNAGNAPQGWPGWPEGKKFALVLSHDVDTRRGHDQCERLMELEEKLGFRSAFSFVPERYGNVSASLRKKLFTRGFEVCVHGLKHDGKLFRSKRNFYKRAERINPYLKQWSAKGFTAPSMHHHLDWMHALNITHSISTFDTDPFEPQSDAVKTIFPLLIYKNSSSCKSSQSATFPEADHYKSNIDRSSRLFNGASQPHGFYVELPYTLAQDFTLFIIMREKSIDIWKKKLDWIAENGGMALLNSHPDYMNFNGVESGTEQYPVKYYTDFIEYIKSKYPNQYWNALPAEIAQHCRDHFAGRKTRLATDPHRKTQT